MPVMYVGGAAYKLVGTPAVYVTLSMHERINCKASAIVAPLCQW
jgi:hypothetical protein